MSEICIALPFLKGFSVQEGYEKQEKSVQGTAHPISCQWGRIFTWSSVKTFPRTLVCLGIDICGSLRWQRLLMRTPEIARRAFTAHERQVTAEEPERLALIWTMKEAFVKALGCGFVDLAYQDIAFEFSLFNPLVHVCLPVTCRSDLVDSKGITALTWELFLFKRDGLYGALILAWNDVDGEKTIHNGPSMICKDTQEQNIDNRVALELRKLPPLSQERRREERALEKIVARDAAFNIVDHLGCSYSHEAIEIKKLANGRPMFFYPGQNEAAVCALQLSLSHCSGWSAAAVGGSFSRGASQRDDTRHDVDMTQMRFKGEEYECYYPEWFATDLDQRIYCCS